MTSIEEIRLIDTKQLQELLGCCYRSAVDIGKKAGAKVMIGTKPRWKVSKINQYLDEKCKEVSKQ